MSPDIFIANYNIAKSDGKSHEKVESKITEMLKNKTASTTATLNLRCYKVVLLKTVKQLDNTISGQHGGADQLSPHRVEFACCPCVCMWFLPQAKGMHIILMDDSKLAMGMNVSVDGFCLPLSNST